MWEPQMNTDEHRSNSKKRFLYLYLSVFICGSISSPSYAQTTKPGDLSARPNQVRGDEITPLQQESVRKGLAWLSQHQARDGGYGAMNGPTSHAGITALAGLAF